MTLATPVVLIIFNRPHLTQVVFEAIARARPKTLFVVADGPRFSGEEEKCLRARAIIDQIDWNCEVLTHYSDANLGCKRRVSTGLTWVFSQTEEAIILEDDCLPAPSFFNFCQRLLRYYGDDERIMMISGDNFQPGPKRGEYSYYFSKYTHTWGWASWKRAWKHYDVDMKTWPEFKKMGLMEVLGENPDEQEYWIGIFDSMFAGKIDTWDYQWFYACRCQNGLSIIPNFNLASNIGFGPEATHTFADRPIARLPTQDIWEIKHPPFVFRDRAADDYTFRNVLGGKGGRRPNGLRLKFIERFVKIGERARSWF